MLYRLFSVFLFGLTFLGDGKQEIVDVVAAAGILCLFVVHRMNGKAIFRLPAPVSAAWAVLLLYLLIKTFFSDSVGYSVTATLRWIMAYLLFTFFYSESRQKQSKENCSRAVLWFGALAIAASVVFTLFEPLGRALPGMNLLYPNYGHNHIANIVVFVLPIALFRLTKWKDKTSFLLTLFFVIALVFSFARGAWLLTGGYLEYFFLISREVSVKTKQLGIGVVLVGALALFLLPTFSTYLPLKAFDNPIFRRQAIKESILASRLQYWKQSMFAIKERPIFGAGPGTFYLSSKRLQEAPSSYSWYAHSFPLELASEIGLIGLIGVIWLVGVVLRRAKRGPLFYGVVLTLIYSLYEINLNFLVIWLLLWSSLGTLFRTDSKRHKNDFLLTISLMVLVLFYVSSVAASIFGLFPAARRFAFYAEPYVVGRAKALLLDEKAVSPVDLGVIDFFHQRDPELLVALAKSNEKSDAVSSIQFYRRAVAADPQNMELLSEYINFLLAQGNSSKAAEALGLDADMSAHVTKELMTDVGVPSNKNEFFAKLYYFLGLALIDKDPEQTRSLWTLARDLTPEWGYFHVELASLENITFHDVEQAKNILTNCRNFLFASAQCNKTEVMNTLPGDQYENIKAIPAISSK